MISGVGPEGHLRSHEIPVVADIAGVGAHLMDHPTVDINLLEKGNNSIYFVAPKLSLTGGLRLLAATLRWMTKGNGPLTCNVSD
jgi:choline dehydrogenase